ncbi:hypothetical protein F2Q69_00041925 [Brassica cretica]|uniref:Uncharacterized protein n=1 Tax=Brassica cretica TaxID=69181 RepID=A0A8S9NH18_BRACR|nr:hypothetical protein F2Q69_00041925 [Brassica cretica]
MNMSSRLWFELRWEQVLCGSYSSLAPISAQAPMNLPMYQTRYMVHAPLTLQLTSAHDSLALSTNVHMLLQIRSPLFLLNRRPIFALLHFGLIRNKYGRWYGPPVRTSPYFRTITQLSPNGV